MCLHSNVRLDSYFCNFGHHSKFFTMFSSIWIFFQPSNINISPVWCPISKISAPKVLDICQLHSVKFSAKSVTFENFLFSLCLHFQSADSFCLICELKPEFNLISCLLCSLKRYKFNSSIFIRFQYHDQFFWWFKEKRKVFAPFWKIFLFWRQNVSMKKIRKYAKHEWVAVWFLL